MNSLSVRYILHNKGVKTKPDVFTFIPIVPVAVEIIMDHNH